MSIMPATLETARLILRPWQPGDLVPFAALNADAHVMEHFRAPLTRAQSDALVEDIQARQQRDGTAVCAVERKSDGAFLGFAGLMRPGIVLPVGPCVEIGWRFAREFWGQGYATEAARAWLAHGFTDMDLDEIVSFTVAANTRSLAVMERPGMFRDKARDFDHPAFSEGHELRPQVLYALTREAWQAA
jgi:RimJ/RimL family protein N-acetyltransferase